MPCFTLFFSSFFTFQISTCAHYTEGWRSVSKQLAAPLDALAVRVEKEREGVRRERAELRSRWGLLPTLVAGMACRATASQFATARADAAAEALLRQLGEEEDARDAGERRVGREAAAAAAARVAAAAASAAAAAAAATASHAAAAEEAADTTAVGIEAMRIGEDGGGGGGGEVSSVWWTGVGEPVSHDNKTFNGGGSTWADVLRPK